MGKKINFKLATNGERFENVNFLPMKNRQDKKFISSKRMLADVILSLLSVGCSQQYKLKTK